MVCEPEDGKLSLPVPTIDYSNLSKDLLDEGHRRLLWQFRNSPNICELLTALFAEIQLFYDAIIDTMDKRQLAKATGEQLEVIGRIVGQDKAVVAAGEGLFGFDNNPLALGYGEFIDGQEVNRGRYSEVGEPETGTRTLSDGEYRNFIVSKILRNHMETASACELQNIANITLNSVTKTFVDTVGPALIEYLFVAPGGMITDDIAIISSVVDDQRADRQRIITAGAGIRIECYAQQTASKIFGFEGDPNPDVGGYARINAQEIMFGNDDSPTPKGWYAETDSTTGAGIHADLPNKVENFTTDIDESEAGAYARIILQG